MNKISNISSSFDLTEINRDEVLDLLNDFESNTSPGVSGIPVIICHNNTKSIEEKDNQFHLNFEVSISENNVLVLFSLLNK